MSLAIGTKLGPYEILAQALGTDTYTRSHGVIFKRQCC